MVNHLHSLIEKRRSIVVTISLVEDCQSHLILLRVDEVVQTKHIQEVHLIARIQSRIEVTLCELPLHFSYSLHSGDTQQSCFASFRDPMQLVILYTATPVFFRFTITRIGSATGKSSTSQPIHVSHPTCQELVGYFNI